MDTAAPLYLFSDTYMFKISTFLNKKIRLKPKEMHLRLQKEKEAIPINLITTELRPIKQKSQSQVIETSCLLTI